MEPERILGFEDQSRAAAEAARDERIGKVQKSDVEEAVIDCICKFTHWGAKQIAKRMGVTPAFVQQVKVKYAAEIKRRCGITVRRPIVNFESTEETVVGKDGEYKIVSADVSGEAVSVAPMPAVEQLTAKEEKEAPHQSPAATASPRSGEAKGEDVPHQSAAPTASPLGSQGETNDVNFVLEVDERMQGLVKAVDSVYRGPILNGNGNMIDDLSHRHLEIVGCDEPENVRRHKAICEELSTLYERKNADYGDSFHQLFEEEGIAASRIRLGDKLNRFKRLSRNYEQNVKGESIRDTLMDMANYAIMTIMEIDRNGGK